MNATATSTPPLESDIFFTSCFTASHDPVLIAFDLVTWLVFLGCTSLSYPLYYAFTVRFGWENANKNLASHYSDLMQSLAYNTLLFLLGDYAHTASWVTVVAYYVGLWGYGALVQVPFLRISLPTFRTWNWKAWAVIVAAIVVALAGAAYHVWYAARTGILWPWYVLGLVAATLVPGVGIAVVQVDACLRQRRSERQRLLGASSMNTNDRVVIGYHATMSTAAATTSTTTNGSVLHTRPETNGATVVLDQAPAFATTILPGSDDPLTGFSIHLHHWQIFFLLAFFTRFNTSISQVCAGIVIAAYMQGGIAYGFDPMVNPVYRSHS